MHLETLYKLEAVLRDLKHAFTTQMDASQELQLRARNKI